MRWRLVLPALALCGCSAANPNYCDMNTPCPMGQACNTVANQCWAPRPGCSPDAFCAAVSPAAVPLRRLWGSAPGDVWVAGDGGTLLHWDGTLLGAVGSGTTASLYGLWGSGAGDIWAAGSGATVLRYMNGAWGVVSAPKGSMVLLTGIWGSGPNDVWFVGTGGTLLHWDGMMLMPVTSPTKSDLYDVSGSGPADVWAVGAMGTVLHWNGSTWSAMSIGTSAPLSGVWVSGANDAWLASGVGIYRGGTAGFNPVIQTPTVVLTSIWGSSTNDVWATGPGGVLVRYNGGWFQGASSGGTATLLSVFGFGPTAPFFVSGAPGVFLRYQP